MAKSKPPRKKYVPKNWVGKTAQKIATDEDKAKFMRLASPIYQLGWHDKCSEHELLTLQGYMIHAYLLHFSVGQKDECEIIYEHLCVIDSLWSINEIDEDEIIKLINLTEMVVKSVREILEKVGNDAAQEAINGVDNQLMKVSTTLFYRSPAYLVKGLCVNNQGVKDMKQLVLNALILNEQKMITAGDGKPVYLTMQQLVRDYNLSNEEKQDVIFSLSVLDRHKIIVKKKTPTASCYIFSKNWQDVLKRVDMQLCLLISKKDLELNKNTKIQNEANKAIESNVRLHEKPETLEHAIENVRTAKLEHQEIDAQIKRLKEELLVLESSFEQSRYAQAKKDYLELHDKFMSEA